jgi:N-acetyl-anhydromuramyl-L-alanine amidase AmpD
MSGDYSDIPYIQAANFGGLREKSKLVVIHATDNTAKALGEAGYASRRTDSVSAHFFVDETSIYQSVPLKNIAYGCLYHGNHSSIQFELCGLSNKITEATMEKAAPYVRRICNRYGIPIKKISPTDVRNSWYSNGTGGICGHGDVTVAFPEDHGTHTDPGPMFPWSKFISYVQGVDTMSLDSLQAAQVNNSEHYLQSIIGLTDKAMGISNTITSQDMPSAFTVAFKKLVADMAEVKSRLTVVLTDEQIQYIADALVAATDNPLGDADKPAIVAAVKQALSEGTGP